MIRGRFGRAVGRVRGQGSTAIPSAPLTQSYLGAAMAIAIAGMGVSSIGGTFGQPSTYTGSASALSVANLTVSTTGGTFSQPLTYNGSALSFSLNTLTVSANGGLFSAPGTFTHYVSATGSAATWAEATNINTPASWQLAMSVNGAVAGNVVAFRGGTYNINRVGATWEYPPMAPVNNGSLGLPITFVNYTAENPHIVGSGASIPEMSATAFGCRGNSYIIWDGFSGALSPNSGAGSYNNNFLFIFFDCISCIARNFTMVGTANGTPTSGGNSAMMIMEQSTACEFYSNDLSGNTEVANATLNCCAIWIFSDTDGIIRNNNIYNNNTAIGQKTANNSGTRIYRNYLLNHSVYGFLLHEEGVASQRCYFYDNLVIDAYEAIFLEGAIVTYPANDWQVFNNTIVRGHRGIISMPYMVDHRIYNNIFLDFNQDLIGYYTTYPPLMQDYNCYYSTPYFLLDWATAYTSIATWTAATGLDANSTNGNPNFINAAGTAIADFVLNTGSSCIGTGLGGVNIGVRDLSLIGKGISIPVRSYTTLISESFNDTNLAGRSWYDMSATPTISTTEQYAGAGCLEITFPQFASTPAVVACRRAFTASNNIYFKARMKYQAGWVGSGGTDHPHEIYFLTNLNGAYDGLSDTFLTAYIENIGGVPQLAIQDAQNIDETNIGVDLIGVTEARSVAGCNGLGGSNALAQQQNCYQYGVPTDHRNYLAWKADSRLFDDANWHLVEAYLEMNTITTGVANFDGKIRYWLDGDLILSRNAVMFRNGNHPTQQFNQIIIAPYIGAGSPIAQTMWIDDLEVGTNLISP